jgi:hypothetical protein
VPAKPLWCIQLGKVWYVCQQHEIQYTECSLNKYTYNYRYNFTHVFFVYIMYNKNMLMRVAKIYKNIIHNLG